MTKVDIIIISLIIFMFLGISLFFQTKFTQLTYKYNQELKEYMLLTKDIKKLEMESKVLSSPDRIINYATKNLKLHLPKLDEVYHIEK